MASLLRCAVLCVLGFQCYGLLHLIQGQHASGVQQEKPCDTLNRIHTALGGVYPTFVSLASGPDGYNCDWFKLKDSLVKQLDEGVMAAGGALDFRNAAICQYALKQASRDCLFDQQQKEQTIWLEDGVCNIQALGSVTPVSDLDFTITCPTHAQEIEWAQKFQQVVLPGSGRLFDTNFYTNVWKHRGKQCKSSLVPEQRIVLALHSLIRGLGPNYFQFADFEIGRFDFNKLESISKTLMAETQVKTAADRVSTYFRLLREGEIEKDTAPATACNMYATALIYANEAYWTIGAVDFTVLHERGLDAISAFEAAMMNLGYAVEHACDELTAATNYGTTKRGEALIKWGKYMARVQDIMHEFDEDNRTPKDSTFEKKILFYSMPGRLMTLKKEAAKETVPTAADPNPNAMSSLYMDLLNSKTTRGKSMRGILGHLGIQPPRSDDVCLQLRRTGFDVGKSIAESLGQHM